MEGAGAALALLVLLATVLSGCLGAPGDGSRPGFDPLPQRGPGSPTNGSGSEPTGNATGSAEEPANGTGPDDATGPADERNRTDPPELTGRVRRLYRSLRNATASDGTVEVEARPFESPVGLTWDLEEPTTFEVDPEPSTVLTDRTWAMVEDRRVDLPFVRAWEGHVADHPDRPFRLVVAEDWARGAIRVGDTIYLIRANLSGNLPGGPGGSAEGEGRRTRPALDPAGVARSGIVECLEAAPTQARPVVGTEGFSGDALRTEIVVDGDAAYRDRLGDDAFPVMVAAVHEMEVIFDYEVGIRYELTGMHLHTEDRFPEPEGVAATGDDSPLDALQSYWNGRHVDRDVVHLLSGKEHDYGQANCIGAIGTPSEAYSFTPIRWADEYTVFHTNAFAHELGHLFAAHHHYGNHVESNLATVMIQGYTYGYRPEFSTVSRSVIRGHAESNLD